jgi:plastocyanin
MRSRGVPEIYSPERGRFEESPWLSRLRFDSARLIALGRRDTDMNRRTALRTLAGVGLGIGLAGCTGEGAQTGGDHDVGMTTRQFRPVDIEVAPGTTVVWKNTSSHAHTVTAYEDQIPAEADYFASGGFDDQATAEGSWFQGGGGALYQGDVYEHTFEVPGDYVYFCIPHEMQGMTGTVTVTEDA